MARPKVSVRVPWLTDSSRSGSLPRAEDQQVTATDQRPSTGSVKNDNQTDLVKKSTTPVVQDLHGPPRIQRPAVQVKAEQNCSPALGEKLPLETPVSATISSTSPGAEGLQATAPAMWLSTPPADKEHGFDAGGRIHILNMIQELQSALHSETEPNRSPASASISTATIVTVLQEVQFALLSETEPNRSPASASISTATVVKVEGVDAGTHSLMPSNGDSQGVSMSKKRKGYKLSSADLVSDLHLRLKDKAEKLGVSVTLFKNRRKAAGLGRWPGRRVRAEMKHAQAQGPA